MAAERPERMSLSMETTRQSASLGAGVTTSYGGENIVGFRVMKAVSRSTAKSAKSASARSLRDANRWLIDNAARVDAHARASTKRLIGREAV